MSHPKVSILWVNYNSASFMDVILKSLEGVNDLNYPNYELIVVDNGSTDGSFEIISRHIERSSMKCKLIKLEKNFGFTGGNNVAYKARDPESVYVVLLNNDAIPEPDSLRRFVEVIESDEELGAVQGIITTLSGKTINTAGDVIDEFLCTHLLFEGKSPQIMKKALCVTFASGAYSMYRVEALKKCGMNYGIFDDEMFAFYDDKVLGLKLWNHDYKVVALPFVVARHKEGATFKEVRPLQCYLSVRSWIVLNEVSNSRYKNYVKAEIVNMVIRRKIRDVLKMGGDCGNTSCRALYDGLRLGRRKRSQGEFFDIYKAPLIRLGPVHLIKSVFLRRTVAEYVRRKIETFCPPYECW